MLIKSTQKMKISPLQPYNVLTKEIYKCVIVHGFSHVIVKTTFRPRVWRIQLNEWKTSGLQSENT